MTATRDQIVNGKLEIGTSGMGIVLATFDLTTGSVAAGILTLAFVNIRVNASANGTAAAARIKTAALADSVTGLTVGLANADVVFDSINFVAGRSVEIATATITHAS